MALAFLNVNGTTSIVRYAGGSYPMFNSDHGTFTVVSEDSIPAVKDLLTNVNAHTYENVMGTDSFLTATYNDADLIVTLHNTPTTAPTTATFSVLGNTYPVAITNGQAVFHLTVHPSMANQRITVAIMIQGFATIYVEAGGTGGNKVVAQYQDANGVVNIVPAKNEDLASYWQSQSFNIVWSQPDIATFLGILSLVLLDKIYPVLENQLTFTPNEKNAINDFISTILPNVPSQLGALAPVPTTGQPQTFDVHYSSLRTHLMNAKTAMDGYVQDRINISKYITLQ